MSRSADPQLRQWWRELLKGFDSTRETVGQFCRRHEVSTASFYRWRQKLARPAAPRPHRQDDGPHRQDDGPLKSSAFVPLQVINSEGVSVPRSIQVHLSGGISIEMPVGEKELLFELVGRLCDPSSAHGREVYP